MMDYIHVQHVYLYYVHIKQTVDVLLIILTFHFHERIIWSFSDLEQGKYMYSMLISGYMLLSRSIRACYKLGRTLARSFCSLNLDLFTGGLPLPTRDAALSTVQQSCIQSLSFEETSDSVLQHVKALCILVLYCNDLAVASCV